MTDEEYSLKENSMLIDGCILNRWFLSLKRHALDFNNPMHNIPPITMFKRKEDRNKLELIKQKSIEIFNIYKELFDKFNRSLSSEDRKEIL